MSQNYLFHALKSPFVQAELKKRATGTTVLGIKQSELRFIEIPFYPMSTQQRITTILSSYDSIIEKNLQRISILEEMARSIFREWYVNRSDENNLSWALHHLEDLVEEGRDRVDPAMIEPSTPYFGLEHMPRRSIALGTWGQAAEVQSTKLRVCVGDVIFGKIRPYFHKVGVAPIDAVCSSDAIVLRPKDPLHFGLILCLVSSDEFVAHATRTSQGTKMPRANWDVLRRYPVMIPPDPLLRQLNEMIRTVVEYIRCTIMRNRNLTHTRDLLLPRLLSGEIDVSSIPLDPAA